MKNVRTLFGFILLLFAVVIFSSCENSKYREWSEGRTKVKPIDYTNKDVLDSLIKEIPFSSDTIFLGIRMGMNKDEYENQMNKIREEGKSITYSKINRFPFPQLGDKIIDLGEGYTFETRISHESATKGVTIGNGKYLLLPQFDRKDGGLTQLLIIVDEDWEGTSANERKWFQNKIIENSNQFSDENLKSFLLKNEFISSYDLIREKGSCIIYEDFATITYHDLKSFYSKLLNDELKKEVIQEKGNDVKF